VHPLVRFAAEVRKEASRNVTIQPVVKLAVPRAALDVESGTYVAAVEKWFVDGAVRVDRLAYAAIGLDGATLESRNAEQLVQVGLKEGRPTPSVSNLDELVAASISLREGPLRERFDRFVGEEAARHEDRAETGLARIEQQRSKRARDIEWKLSEWKRSGDPKKLRLIPAEQGKLDRLLARLDHKREQLEQARDRFAFQQDLVGIAVIQVVDA
jgi:hypothetical protein